MKIKLSNNNYFYFDNKENGYFEVKQISNNYTYFYISINNIVKENEDYFIELKQDLYNVELITFENKEHNKRNIILNQEELKHYLNFELSQKTYYYYEFNFTKDNKIFIQAFKTKEEKEQIFKYDEEVIKRKWNIDYYFSQDLTTFQYLKYLNKNISEKELSHFETLNKEIKTRVILKNLINLLNHLNNNDVVIDLCFKEYLNSELLELLKEVDLNFYLALKDIFKLDYSTMKKLIENQYSTSKYKKLDKKNYFNNIFKQLFYRKEII